jgi:hypothetical protein
MKKLTFLTALLAVSLCACAPKVRVEVENPLAIDRSAELVQIPTFAFSKKIALSEGETYQVSTGGEVIPSQVTHDGLLVFQSGLGTSEKATFIIKAGAPQEFAPKTYGRFAPERMDDFIWENDRVAFRIYGTALIAKDGPSNGIDALYKRAEEPVLDKWYADYFSEPRLSYHDDHGTGLDNYNVKRSLGAGAAAPFVGGELLLNSNFTGWELLDNGPLRTSFRLTYPEMEINGAPASETRTFTLDAGSQLTRVEQEWGVSEPISAAVGFVLRSGEVQYGAAENVLMVGEPDNDKVQGVYLGAVLPDAFGDVTLHEYEVPEPAIGAGEYRHVLAVAPYTPGSPLTYYTGFGWEKWGDWTSDSFADYLVAFASALDNPLIVHIK